MKKSINFSEFFLWVIMLIPFVYLATIWSDLPETVATHFNAQGEADSWGSKTTLIWLPLLLVFSAYFILWLVPKIDPKKKLANMGRKYNQLRWILIGLMSAIAILVIYSAKMGGLAFGTNLLFVVLGLFFMLLGNYFPTIKHNYFVGIRTPWTLENETVWKKTHRLAGGWWMAGGAAIILASLILDAALAVPVFIAITTVIALVPMVYSYLEFRRVSESSVS